MSKIVASRAPLPPWSGPMEPKSHQSSQITPERWRSPVARPRSPVVVGPGVTGLRGVAVLAPGVAVVDRVRDRLGRWVGGEPRWRWRPHGKRPPLWAVFGVVAQPVQLQDVEPLAVFGGAHVFGRLARHPSPRARWQARRNLLQSQYRAPTLMQFRGAYGARIRPRELYVNWPIGKLATQ